MNKTPIDWAQFSWNPMTGCLHGCPYCYARRMAESPRFRLGFPHRFEPTFYPERLEEPLKVRKASSIFVCSMGDLLGTWVAAQQVRQVIGVMARAWHHVFFVLTKNPIRYREFDWPSNVWMGTSLTASPLNSSERIRMATFLMATNHYGNPKFLSLEPFTAVVLRDFYVPTQLSWLIVGGQTKPQVRPTGLALAAVLAGARAAGVPVLCKANLGLDESFQEWPAALAAFH